MLVLILVVVDDGLVHHFNNVGEYKFTSLNPCCSGRWSRTFISLMKMIVSWVLILVVVDDGLVHMPRTLEMINAAVKS